MKTEVEANVIPGLDPKLQGVLSALVPGMEDAQKLLETLKSDSNVKAKLDDLNKQLKNMKPLAEESKISEGIRSKDFVMPKVEVQGWRVNVCKLTGVIGGTKGISFEDLNFQIRNAKLQGYTEQNIIGR